MPWPPPMLRKQESYAGRAGFLQQSCADMYYAKALGQGENAPNAELPEGPDSAYKAHPLWVAIARSSKFKLSWKRTVKRSCHINIGEFQVFLRTEKMAKIKGKAIKDDSRVPLKGRSTSHHLTTASCKLCCLMF